MLKFDNNIYNLNYVLDSLRDEDLEEVKAIWNNKWKENVIVQATKYGFITLFGKNNKHCLVPIAIGGFAETFPHDTNISCVWLLSSKDIKYNKTLLIKTLKQQISLASSKYKLMYNYIYKSNFEAKKWLKKLGFTFNNQYLPNNSIMENFEFFYKIII